MKEAGDATRFPRDPGSKIYEGLRTQTKKKKPYKEKKKQLRKLRKTGGKEGEAEEEEEERSRTKDVEEMKRSTRRHGGKKDRPFFTEKERRNKKHWVAAQGQTTGKLKVENRVGGIHYRLGLTIRCYTLYTSNETTNSTP